MTNEGTQVPERMAEPADLAVVVVNYNTGPYLARCLHSAIDAAGDARLEVVVIDNASGDGSADVAAGHQAVRLIRNDSNRGFAAAANQGIAVTSAPFILLLNPDAEVVSGTIAGFVKVARDRPRAGAIGAMVRDPDGTIYPSARKVPTLGEAVGHAFLGPFMENRYSRAYTMSDWDRRTERGVEWVSGSCVLLRREALDAVGVFDEGYFMYVEDVDLCTRLRRAGWDVLYSPELEVLHIGGVSTGGYRSRRMTLEHSRSIYRYFVKHRSHGALAILRPVVRLALRLRAELVLARGRQHRPTSS
ncbi:MAG TPA: glycosyltransferase family 2 protein [Actinomycetota bacterium]|nr:glycosyltransferase family 2 protein [Actinomycetota bacterium]